MARSWQLSYYGFDGHGSVRYLTNAQGAVTDTYDYDAFGNLIASTGTTPNNYLFAGEQWDPNLNLYYNRARYLDVRSGRFWSMDASEGDPDSPNSLHRYLYASSDPVNRTDPSGNDDLVEFSAAQSINQTINNIAVLALKGFLFGTAFGAADAYLQNKSDKEIASEALQDGLIGAVLGPLSSIKFVAPVLVALGTVAGLSGTLDAIEQKNYPLAALRALGTYAGFRTFIELPEEPITGGRLGGPATRQQVAEIAQDLMSRGWKITGGGGLQPEEYLPPAGELGETT